MCIYHKRRLPTGRRKLWMRCTPFAGANIPFRRIGYGVAGTPHRNAIPGSYRGVSLGFGWRAQGRSGRINLVGARCP